MCSFHEFSRHSRLTDGSLHHVQTERGWGQARAAGARIKELMEKEGKQYRLYFYTSPYKRSNQTYQVSPQHGQSCVCIAASMSERTAGSQCCVWRCKVDVNAMSATCINFWHKLVAMSALIGLV